MSRKGKGSLNTEQFGEDEKRKISEIHDIVTGLKDEIKVLKKELLETKQELKEIKAENKKIKQSLNINIYCTNKINLNNMSAAKTFAFMEYRKQPVAEMMGKM